MGTPKLFVLLTYFAIVDYNSWIESPKALKLASKLPKDVVLAEGMCFASLKLASSTN